MGQLLPVNKRIHSSRLGLRNETTVGDLPRGRHCAFVSDLLGGDLRDLDAPATPVATRGRSSLERLLGSLDPAAAPIHAETLLREFGSLPALFNAAPEEIDRALLHVIGAGAVIAAAREFTQEALYQLVRGSPVRSDDAALHRYLQSILGRLPEEHLHVVFVDREGGYITDEEIGAGGVDSLSVHFRAVFRRAMTLEAAAILLAHNHPSGVSRPSLSDIHDTREMRQVGRCLGIHLIDHLIVTVRSIYSMTEAGLA